VPLLRGRARLAAYLLYRGVRGPDRTVVRARAGRAYVFYTALLNRGGEAAPGAPRWPGTVALCRDLVLFTPPPTLLASDAAAR